MKTRQTLSALLLTWTMATVSIACEHDPERSMVDAILNLDASRFDEAAVAAEGATLRIPSIAFYDALRTWYRGYQEDNKSLKSNGIKSIREAISDIDDQLRDKASATSLLASGLARGHFARVLLEGGNLVEGYRYGMQARKRITRYLEIAPPDAPGRADAGLLAGLYEVYTHDLQNRFHWLTGRIDYRGDRERGIRLLEGTLTGQGAFSSEAMRALLGEVSWRTPDFCRYIDVVERKSRRLERNSDLSVLAIGLMLKCGHPKRAARLVAWHRSRQPVSAVHDQLERATLRIHADLGDVQALEVFSPGDPDPHHLLAVANALDVRGRRSEALGYYQRILDMPGIAPVFQSVAEIRRSYPYQPPARRTTTQFFVADCGLDLANAPGVR